MMIIALGVLVTTPAFSASDNCRSIRSDSARLACFDKQAIPVAADNRQIKTAKESSGSKFVDPADLLQAENDRVAARLKGICRGC
jgi:hypothetical protein